MVPRNGNKIGRREKEEFQGDQSSENFVNGPAILLTEGVRNLRLDELLTLIAITHGNLGGLMNLTRYLEQMKVNVRKFDVKRSTDSWKKIRDLRHTLIQYLLQQKRFGTERMKRLRGRKTCDAKLGACPYQLI